jgi:hypothetical protein
MSALREDERGIHGTWIAGENTGERATIKEVRAGWLYAHRLPEGTPVSGDAAEFRADTGETGMALLERLLSRPKVASLFNGAMRESLAAVYSIARVGRDDTHGWEDTDRYIVGDSEGCTAIAAFLPAGCVVATSNKDPSRKFDTSAALAVAPPTLRAELAALCALPVFQFQGRSAITAIFWSEGEFFEGPEPWPNCYIFGGEIFHHELLDEEAWKARFPEWHSSTREEAEAIAQIARRSSRGCPTALSAQEIRFLVPPDSKHRDEALDQLFSGGVFKATQGEP